MYKTTTDADFRLAGTIIAVGDKPASVAGSELAADGTTVVLRYREHPYTGGVQRLPISDPAFNKFQPFELGYINYFDGGERHASYGERLPVRRTKQGLSDENCSFTNARGARYRLSNVQSSSAFAELVAGTYPTSDEVLELLIPDSTIAVSRDFALTMDGGGAVTLLYRRDTRVGTFFRGQLYVTNDKQWLLESIIEEPNLPSNAEIF